MIAAAASAAAMAAPAEASEQPMTATAIGAGVAAAMAAGVAGAVAAGVTRVAASNLLLDATAHHAAAGVRLAVRDAANNRAAGLVGNQFTALHAAGDLTLDRYTLTAVHGASLFLDDGLVAAHFARNWFGFANGPIAGNRAFFPGRARNPAADRLHRNAAARIAAAIAARIAAMIPAVEETATIPAEVIGAGNLLALPMAAVDAASNDLGVRLAPIAGLHHRSFFDVGNAAADLLGDRLGAIDHLVLANIVGASFWNADAAIRGVGFLPALAAVHGSCTLVRFGDPFLTTHGTVLGRGRRGTRCRLRSVIISPCGHARRGQDTASQQGNANVLPDHCLLLCCELADPRRHRTFRWAGPDNQ